MVPWGKHIWYTCKCGVFLWYLGLRCLRFYHPAMHPSCKCVQCNPCTRFNTCCTMAIATTAAYTLAESATNATSWSTLSPDNKIMSKIECLSLCLWLVSEGRVYLVGAWLGGECLMKCQCCSCVGNCAERDLVLTLTRQNRGKHWQQAEQEAPRHSLKRELILPSWVRFVCKMKLQGNTISARVKPLQPLH